jgi:hypothetical protein
MARGYGGQGGVEGGFVQAGVGEDDVAGGIEEHETGDARLGELGEEIFGGVKIWPRLFVLNPEVSGFLRLFVFIKA